MAYIVQPEPAFWPCTLDGGVNPLTPVVYFPSLLDEGPSLDSPTLYMPGGTVIIVEPEVPDVIEGHMIYAHFSDDVAPNATITVNTGTEDATYPKANLVDRKPEKIAALTTTTGSYVFAYGSPQRVDWVMLSHTNLLAGLEVRIQGNASNVWTAPTFNQLITIPAVDEDGFQPNPWLDLTDKSGYSAAGFLFWRVVVVGTNNVPIAFGNIKLIRLKRTFVRNIKWGIKHLEEHGMVENETEAGVVRTHALRWRKRRLTGEIHTTTAGIAAIRSLWRDTLGRVRPFAIVLNPAANEAMEVRFSNRIQEVGEQFLDSHTYGVQFDELSRGLPYA